MRVHSTTRRERARATRRRILEVAYALIVARGYADTTMADVAAEAGVAVQTVYLTFRNKPGLLRAAFAFAVHGDHEPVPPAQREWYRRVMQEPDQRRALELVVGAMLTIQRRVTPLAPVLQAFRHDLDISEFQRLDHALRLDGFRRMAGELARKGGLRAELTLDEAALTLMALLAGDSYRMLVLDAGWTDDQWASWALRVASETILPA